ncbi:TonB-dependent receptor [Paucibacter sp. B2R-40]|uniref:TonB-dependent receptor n=1 Tax=Paucibacter sp. B2R-40 TaxID=2893554 RepID=UPI0021E4BBE7|nr:TonB-dependent receptor [Paucibacter sp. B2R-40]MCV2352580.1 TonB-dependent receptor [Paucibacter sp. B2R-40]
MKSRPKIALLSLQLTVLALACQQAAAGGDAGSDANIEANKETQTLAPVLVIGNYLNGVGSSDAASQGAVSARLIASRPTLRPAELLEFVPGVIVTQHSGGGKANQYFLRGFNLDHGTDFATFVDGMPVNMPTHAHGHGYSDLNWLIPEVVNRISYKKGPYFADVGDFSSAGAARFELAERMDAGLAELTLGQNGYRRALLANSVELSGGDLLFALEASHNNGPWENPENLRRKNGVLRYSFGPAEQRSSITAMAYEADWNSTDQIPLRAVQAGLVGRFGAVDPSDGGHTARQSLSFATERKGEDGGFKFNAYAIKSRLDLFSNFTYFLEHPVDLDPGLKHGDQFEQAERRQVYGLAGSRSWDLKVGGLETSNTVGLQVRHDRLNPVGLYESVARERVGTIQQSQVRQTSVGLLAENSTQWLPWLRSVAGLRFDQLALNVSSSIAANSGSDRAHLSSPKLSLIFGPWQKTEAFVNYGQGFHSNDARGATARVSAKENLPVDAVQPLVRAKGSELGLRSEIIPGLQSSLALWQLSLASELVFVGDAGETEASRASRRSGIEWNNHYQAASWLLLDADVALSRARYTEFDPAGDHVPGAINRVLSAGATLSNLGPWSGQFQLRYFGPRALTEDNSQRSKATTLAQMRIGYRINANTSLNLDVFNLFASKASDIDYYYASRLKGEPAAGVPDIHFHPVEPRSLRLGLTMGF